jgi:hypothetical protein
MQDPKWEITLLDSTEIPERDRCVDIFRRADGSFGFEEWRREPEEPGRWFRARYHGDAVYATADAAVAMARILVTWYGAQRQD